MALRKRGGVWYYDFMIRGVRYKKAVPEARTRREAEQAEAQARLLVFQDRYGRPEGGDDFAQFVAEHYLPWAKLNKRSSYDDVLICRTLCEYFRGKTLAQISPILVERFKRERASGLTRSGTPRQPATVNRELAVLSRIFSLAMEQDRAATNPCLRVKKLRLDNARTRYLSPEEEERLMRALETRPHLRPIVVTALHTGMRRGEILKLRWREVDLGRGLIFVKQTKTGRDRTIPINTAVRAELEALMAENENGEQEYVFVSEKTGSCLVEIKLAWRSSCREAGLTDLHFHDLRHTAATRLAEAGADAFTIAAILGHATIQMSARYTHATSEAKRRAVERLAEAGRICPKFVPKQKRQELPLAVND